MINKMIPIVAKAGQLFREGIRIAQAIVQVCIVGACASAILLGKLIGLVSDEIVIEEGDDPP